MSFFQNIFRRRALKKFAYKGERNIAPTSRIKTATVILDVEDPSYDKCYDEIKNYFTKHQIDAIVFYIDLRKLDKYDMLQSNVEKTLLNKELNWYGRPDIAKMAPMINSEHPRDLLICLPPINNFPIKFIATASAAKFKIGVVTKKTDGVIASASPFDITISAEAGSHDCLDTFKTITNLLDTIN